MTVGKRPTFWVDARVVQGNGLQNRKAAGSNPALPSMLVEGESYFIMVLVSFFTFFDCYSILFWTCGVGGRLAR